MKKIITLCFFVFALLLSTQSVVAQENLEANEKALAKAKELRSEIKFNDETLEDIFKAYQVYYNKLESINTNLESRSADYTKALKKLNANLDANIKASIGEKLYQKYKGISEESKIAKKSYNAKK